MMQFSVCFFPSEDTAVCVHDAPLRSGARNSSRLGRTLSISIAPVHCMCREPGAAVYVIFMEKSLPLAPPDISATLPSTVYMVFSPDWRMDTSFIVWEYSPVPK